MGDEGEPAEHAGRPTATLDWTWRSTQAVNTGQRCFGSQVTHLNRSWTSKCIFEVHGPKQNRSTSLRTPSAFYSLVFVVAPSSTCVMRLTFFLYF